MTQKQYLKINLTAGLFIVSMGGWLLHLRIHPLTESLPANLVPFVSGVISVIILPLMFLSSRATAYAYAGEVMTVIIGTITMGHLLIARLTPGITLEGLILKTVFPDIVILWIKLPVAKTLFEINRINVLSDERFSGKFLRYPNSGWWYAHFAAMSAVYALGHFLWK